MFTNNKMINRTKILYSYNQKTRTRRRMKELEILRMLTRTAEHLVRTPEPKTNTETENPKKEEPKKEPKKKKPVRNSKIRTSESVGIDSSWVHVEL